jgi:tetratricopeptide (TPR) repeat protein
VTTPLVAFLDDDVVPAPGWLDAHLRFHALHPEEWAACFGAVPLTAELRAHPAARYLEDFGPYQAFRYRRDGDRCFPLLTGNTSLKTEFVRQGNGFDERFIEYGNEDTELGLRLAREGLQCWFSEQARADHWHAIDCEGLGNLVYQAACSAAGFALRDPAAAAPFVPGMIDALSAPPCEAERVALLAAAVQDPSRVALEALVIAAQRAGYAARLRREPDFESFPSTLAALGALSPRDIECRIRDWEQGGRAPAFLWLAGAAFADRHAPQVAIPLLEAALRVVPDLPWAGIRLARAFDEDGRPDRAARLLDDLEPRLDGLLQLDALRVRAEMLARQGRGDAVRVLLSRYAEPPSVGCDPVEWHSAVAAVHVHVRSAAGIVPHLDWLVSRVTAPGLRLRVADLMSRAVAVLREAGDLAAARRTARWVLEYAETDDGVGSWARIEAALAAAALDPGSAPHYRGLALAELHRDGSADPLARYRCASVLERLGERDAAAEAFTGVLRMTADPQLAAGAHFHLGAIARAGGDLAGALEHLRACCAVSPGHVAAQRMLSELMPTAVIVSVGEPGR